MRRKDVVFSQMFVLRSMGNELVPSPLFACARRENKAGNHMTYIGYCAAYQRSAICDEFGESDGCSLLTG